MMSITEILKDIETLVVPDEEHRASLEKVFVEKMKKFDPSQDFPSLQSFQPGEACAGKIWWKYVCFLLEKLLQLKCALEKAEEKEQLLSVNQKKFLTSCLEMAVTLGIVSHLPNGIGIGLKQRSSSEICLFQDVTEKQRICSMKLVSSVLMELRKDDTFLTLITSRHLGDLLAALFSLLVPGVWTEPLPEEERTEIKAQLEDIVENTFQPFLIKELMLLNGNKDCPLKLSKAIRGIMTERMMLQGGVISTIRAILDMVGNISPKQWKTVEVLARLIINPHIKDVKAYQNAVYPQVLALLYTEESQYVQISVSCVRMLYESERDICKEYFLDPLIAPFTKPSSEKEMTSCVNGLYNCFGIPSSEHWSLNADAFQEVHLPLFRLYCKTINSVTFLKQKLANMTWAIISQNDFDDIFDKFVFKSSDIAFDFGEEGGVVSVEGKEQPYWEEASEVLLNLIVSRESGEVTVKLFNCLMNIMVDGDLEKKLVGAKILSEICAEPAVQEAINKDPSGIVKFVNSLLDGEFEEEIICVGLMVLGVIISNRSANRGRDWEQFKQLADPLKAFAVKCKTRELRVLADEMYSTIMTHGAVGNEKNKKNIERKPKTSYAVAMEEATDNMMPIRAHGLRELGKLLLHNDEQCITNKELILCAFKENLREEDSYVYLAAIEGLAAIASVFPDEVITSLCEQYAKSTTPETRLKVGEALMKVIRLLNEMAVAYKHELVNAFLDGCRDEDHLVRASSLSNLGELCKILSYRIHTYMTEILYCIECIFETDKFIEPKRAAIMVLTSLLKGLGSDALSVLEPVLLEIYRKLKLIYQVEKDDITRLHAQLALEEINHCTISFFSQPQKLEKRIFVLDPPT